MCPLEFPHFFLINRFTGIQVYNQYYSKLKKWLHLCRGLFNFYEFSWISNEYNIWDSSAWIFLFGGRFSAFITDVFEFFRVWGVVKLLRIMELIRFMRVLRFTICCMYRFLIYSKLLVGELEPRILKREYNSVRLHVLWKVPRALIHLECWKEMTVLKRTITGINQPIIVYSLEFVHKSGNVINNQ